MTSKTNGLGEKVLVALIAAPAVGVLMGGVYSMPAIRVTGGRDPNLERFGMVHALALLAVFLLAMATRRGIVRGP